MCYKDTIVAVLVNIQLVTLFIYLFVVNINPDLTFQIYISTIYSTSVYDHYNTLLASR